VKVYAAAWLAHERAKDGSGNTVLSLSSGIVFAENHEEAMGKLMAWAKGSFPIFNGYFNHLVAANEIGEDTALGIAETVDNSEQVLEKARAAYEQL